MMQIIGTFTIFFESFWGYIEGVVNGFASAESIAVYQPKGAFNDSIVKNIAEICTHCS